MTVTSMPQPTLPAQRVPTPAEEAEDVILGVDTHKDVHVAAVITALGASLAHQEFPATSAGYRQLLTWARSFGVLCRAGVECTGSCARKASASSRSTSPTAPPAQARQDRCHRR